MAAGGKIEGYLEPWGIKGADACHDVNALGEKCGTSIAESAELILCATCPTLFSSEPEFECALMLGADPFQRLECVL